MKQTLDLANKLCLVALSALIYLPSVFQAAVLITLPRLSFQCKAATGGLHAGGSQLGGRACGFPACSSAGGVFASFAQLPPGSCSQPEATAARRPAFAGLPPPASEWPGVLLIFSDTNQFLHFLYRFSCVVMLCTMCCSLRCCSAQAGLAWLMQSCCLIISTQCFLLSKGLQQMNLHKKQTQCLRRGVITCAGPLQLSIDACQHTSHCGMGNTSARPCSRF